MNLKKLFINLLFPMNCLGCHQEGDCLCPACFKKLKSPGPPHNLATPYLDELYLAGDYQDELLAKLIKEFKFKGLMAIGEKLGLFLALFWQGPAWRLTTAQPSGDANNQVIGVIPIPLSKKRRRERGFNQTEILGRVFSAYFSYPLLPGLYRKYHRPPQSSLSEAARLRNISQVFAWQGPPLDGQTIILVDDVATTGATLNEAARVLKEAGAKKIYGLALAKG